MNRMKRIAEIEALARTRSLSDPELDEFNRLLNWRAVKLSRLPRQIAACEAKLDRLRRNVAALS